MNVTTRINSTGSVTAKAAGKQRTVPFDSDRDPEVNSASAVGTLLNVLLDGQQQSKLRHPSGAQRVRVEPRPDFSFRWTIDV